MPHHYVEMLNQFRVKIIQNTSPAFSVLALFKRSEKTGPGHNIVIFIPVPTFSDLRELKYPCNWYMTF